MPRTEQRPRYGDQARADQQARENAQLRDDLHRLLSEEWGRRVAAHVLRRSGIHTPAFEANAMLMASKTGKQELGLEFRRDLIAADPNAYLQMESENDT